MLTEDDCGAIRRARRDGKSNRQIVREFDRSRITIRKALKYPEPVAKSRNRSVPKLGPFQAMIDLYRDSAPIPTTISNDLA